MKRNKLVSIAAITVALGVQPDVPEDPDLPKVTAKVPAERRR